MQVDDISAISILIPLITAGIVFRHLNKTLKKLSVFILFSAITETIAAIYFEYGWNNQGISHLYAFIQVPLLAWIFYDLVTGYWQKAVLVLTGGYLIFSVINLMLWENLIEFNSNQRYFAAVCIISFCAFYFIRIFIDMKIIKIERDPYFWIASSILIYAAGTLFLFIFIEETPGDYWELNCVLNICLNLGLTLSLWMGTRTKTLK